jgi:arginyl-tRNA synthetase
VETVKKKLENDLKTISKELKFEVEALDIGQPRKKEWGDYMANIAFKVKNPDGKKPSQIAKLFEAKINEVAEGYTAQAAGDGFINFTIETDYLHDLVSSINQNPRNFGKSDAGRGKKVQIEFISANPTGPLTLGNGRGAFTGDTLANLYALNGYTVEREYYVNNVGNQIRILGYSVAKEMGLVSEEEEEFYAGSYIKDLAAQLQDEVGKLESRGDSIFYFQVGQLAAEVMLTDIQRVVKDKLGISFDRYFLESDIYSNKKDQKYLSQLEDKKLVFEKDGATWFKSSQFGDDKDRVIIRADGEPTYFLSDIVHKNEFAKEFDLMVMLLGADHYGYQGRLQAALQAFDYKDKLRILIFQLVRLIKDGQEVRMSKRAGTYVALEDLIDEVGIDAARFFFLLFAQNTHLDFDLELAKKKSNDNPVYYVQYAHARLCRILKKAGLGEDEGSKGEKGNGVDLSLLNHPRELELMRLFHRFPELVEELIEDYQLQKLPHYCLELAEALHRFYQECTVISDDKKLTASRLELVKAAKIVLKQSLELMGIAAPESM